MKPSEKRSLIFLVMIGIIALGAVFFFVSLSPLIQRSLFLNETLNKEKEEFNLQNAKIKEAMAFLDEYRKDVEGRKTISLILPTKEEIPQVINQLAEAAGFNSLFLRNIHFFSKGIVGGEIIQSEKATTTELLIKNFNPIEMGIEVSGKYQNIKNWIKFIESNMRLMDISIISFTPDLTREAVGGDKKGGDYSNPDLSAKIRLNIYYQPK